MHADMTTIARAMGDTSVLSKIAPGQTYSPVDAAVQYIKHWSKPVMDHGGMPKMVDGEAINEMWVRYKTVSVAGQTEIDERMDAIMDVGDNDDPDHLMTNLLKARREAILVQMKQAADNTAGVMPNDHMPLRKWGALPEPVVLCLESNGIHSVQQLRDCRESKLHQLPPGLNPMRMREMARAYIDNMATASATTVVSDYEARIASMEKQNARLAALLEQLVERKADEAIADADAPKRGGRKPKAVEAAEAEAEAA